MVSSPRQVQSNVLSSTAVTTARDLRDVNAKVAMYSF